MTSRGVYMRLNHAGEERWYVRIMVEGRYQRFAPHGGFLTEKEAALFLQQARVDITRGKFFPDHFMRETLLLEDLLTEQTDRITKTANAKNDRKYQEWWIQHYGQQNARVMTPAHIDQARQRLIKEGKRDQTVHHYLKFLRHRFNLALRDEQLRRSPFQRLKLEPVKNLRVRFYSTAEREAVYRALGPEWREAAELAGVTGLRWSEQFRLTREHIHLREGFVFLPTTKAGEPQARLLNQRAKELLERQLERHDRPWLYPNVAGTGPMNYTYFLRRIWHPACVAAQVVNARWNDWRHTFATDLTEQGHSERTIAHLMGHKDTEMVKRYAHLSDPHLRQAVESITPKGKS